MNNNFKYLLLLAIITPIFIFDLTLNQVDTYTYVDRTYLTSKKEENNKIIYYNHSTESRNINDIKEIYNASLYSTDYTILTNVYKTNPIYTAPYYEGSLKDGVIADTLKQINYYRALTGLTPVTLNSDKMRRNQIAALTQAINIEMTHEPAKPAGMDDEYHKLALAGAGAGTDTETNENYTANVSEGSRETMPKSISGYVDDINNVELGVGHRSSMLDPFAQRTSFGFAGQGSYNYKDANYSKHFFTAVSNYRKIGSTQYVNPGNNEDFYPYPNAGIFPIEATRSKDTNSNKWLSWSIWIKPEIQTTATTSITLTYKDKTYTINKDKIETDTKNQVGFIKPGTYSTTLSWKLPDELAKQVTAANGNYLPNTTIAVKINNLKDTTTNKEASIEYSTTFQTVIAKIVEEVTLDVFLDEKRTSYYPISPDETINLSSINFENNLLYYIGATYKPDNAIVTNLKYEVENPKVATFDEETMTLKVLRGGETNLIITDEYSGQKFTYKIILPIVLQEGQKVNIADLTSSKILNNFSRAETSNILIDLDGNITTLAEGPATIYYVYHNEIDGKNYYNYMYITIVERDKTPGDINGDGSISLTDVLLELKYFFSQNYTAEELLVLDMNDDGKIDLTDILILLKSFFART